MIPIETLLISVSVLLIVSIIASKASSRFGIPSLLLFLFVGMIAGSEGLKGVYFDNPRFAQNLGVVALVFILFSGGLDTEWKTVRSLWREGLALSTLGVLLTAVLSGWFAITFLRFSLFEGLLLGSIISSTDAAAVFSVLRTKKVSLTGELKPLLELESGSNDPMAVFLTLGFIKLILGSYHSASDMLVMFFFQMGLGASMGYILGKGIVYFVNKIRLENDGLYPVLTVSSVLFTYALTTVCSGNGFLAVYIAGVILGESNFVQKRNLIHFHSGLAWLMQIVMFLALGLLVIPSHLVPVALAGSVMALFLLLIARPAGVFLTLALSKFNLREKTLISWVGLRGSVPIILATFPLLAGVERAGVIFNIVFFVVLSSTLVQGTSIPLVAKLLGVAAPFKDRKHYPLEFEQNDALNTRLIDFTIPYNSWLVGKPLLEVGLPPDSLITLVARNEDFIVPSGKTTLDAGDVLLILVNNNNLVEVQNTLSCATEVEATG